MDNSRKHSLAPESVTSASSAGLSYSQKRRRVVQHTPVPEKYIYRHSTSRLPASRGSSVFGGSEALDGSPSGARDWARASTLSDGVGNVNDGDKGKSVGAIVDSGPVEVKRSSVIPESPFARIISRKRQSRGIATTTTSLAYSSPNGSLRSNYGAHYGSAQGNMASPYPLYTASVRHTTANRDRSPPLVRPSSSGSQHIHSSFQRSTFEFTSPFKTPKPVATLNTPEENKAKSDSLLSFLGSALSRAKSALTENRELQEEERKRKLKEDARQRAIEAERQKRDEIFAEIAREEEELAMQPSRKDKDILRSVTIKPNYQPRTTTTVSQTVSSSRTIVHEPNTPTEHQSDYTITLPETPHIRTYASATRTAVDNTPYEDSPTNKSGRRTIILNSPVQLLPQFSTSIPDAPKSSSPVEIRAKVDPEVICLDSSDGEEEDQGQQR